ncbi:hypothetical protein [Roseovarius mucosus]|uniref:hypothetical protein n=1 Tax=Roseovarius mucosus TaxID=215743 RepID=UPI0011AF2A72|nr:hypothetical protein [Roseovarius mucosus]|tara:strand:+ start:160 stop:420 length:261 start_codon:yes stop_codon:yes gene_type:complete
MMGPVYRAGIPALRAQIATTDRWKWGGWGVGFNWIDPLRNETEVGFAGNARRRISGDLYFYDILIVANVTSLRHQVADSGGFLLKG